MIRLFQYLIIELEQCKVMQHKPSQADIMGKLAAIQHMEYRTE